MQITRVLTSFSPSYRSIYNQRTLSHYTTRLRSRTKTGSCLHISISCAVTHLCCTFIIGCQHQSYVSTASLMQDVLQPVWEGGVQSPPPVHVYRLSILSEVCFKFQSLTEIEIFPCAKFQTLRHLPSPSSFRLIPTLSDYTGILRVTESRRTTSDLQKIFHLVFRSKRSEKLDVKQHWKRTAEFKQQNDAFIRLQTGDERVRTFSPDLQSRCVGKCVIFWSVHKSEYSTQLTCKHMHQAEADTHRYVFESLCKRRGSSSRSFHTFNPLTPTVAKGYSYKESCVRPG